MKKILCLALALLMLLGFSACGSSYSGNYAVQSAPAEYAAGSYDYAAEEPAPMPEAAEFGGFSDSAANDDPAEIPDVDPSKIIYSADVNIETTKFDDSIAALEKMIEEVGGWIESSSISGNNYYQSSHGLASSRVASYTLRVPGEKFAGMMNSFSKLGNVPYSHTYTQNVTAQYYDTQARLTACQTQEARLLEMMEVAQTVEDVITIEDRLTDLRYQIERLQSSLKNWDRQVSYSTISLNIQEVQEYTPETLTEPSYGERLAHAFTNGLRSVARFFKEFLVWFLGALPTLVVLAAVAALLIAVLRPLRRAASARREKRRAAKAEKSAARQEPKRPEQPSEQQEHKQS